MLFYLHPRAYLHPPTIDLSNSSLEEFQQLEFEGYGPKASKSVCKDTSNEVKKTPDAPLGEKLVSKKRDTLYIITICFDHVQAHYNYHQREGMGHLQKEDQGYRICYLLGKEPEEEELLVKELLKLLPDESQVLLKVPRKNNMYNVDMKNIVPKESSTCLVAKATLDESMLWHMRLGHINFKTINKLVKDNLVRGLPTKCFENDQTCVACLKGKQHKVSCLKREFSVARTPQQNSVAEMRNRTLIEAARTMLANSKLPTTFWAEAVNTACYVQYRVIIVKRHNKTPYELFRGRTLTLSFMRPFGCHVTILNTLDHLGKFDEKSDDGFFVGYSLTSKAFRVYNIRTRKVEENLHIRFLENKPIVTSDGLKCCSEESNGAGHTSKETKFIQDYIMMPLWKDGSMFDSSSKNSSDDEPQPSSNAKKKDDEGVIITTRSNRSQNVSNMFSLGRSATLEATHDDLFSDETEMDMSNRTTSYQVPTTPNTRIHNDHSLDHVIGDIQSGVQTRGMLKNTNEHGFISAVYEGKTHKDLHTCLFACFLSQEEPKRIAKALSDPEGIDYDEVFAPVASIEAIRLFLAYASFMAFMLYQMDVKSAFLYGTTEEEVYVCQPPGFEDPDYPDKVYKVVKALYGLHQALRAWYGTLAKYLLDNGFQRGKIDQTLFIKKQKGDILLVQVYVDGIIFGYTSKELCAEFEKLLHYKFQMSFMRELNFFLGLQVNQREDGIFISQDKYVAEILRKFGFTDVRTASTLMDSEKPLLKDSDGDDVDVHLYRSMIGSLLNSPFELVAYSDNDYAGASLDRKSTTGCCQFLGCRLISWQCKKQTVVATSSTKAEYVAAASCCGQVLWIQNQMLDYRISTARHIEYLVGDEVIHKELGDRMERATTTASSLEAEQDSGLRLHLNSPMIHLSQEITHLEVERTASAKAKIVNGERQIQALVDKKKVIIYETSIRSDLKLDNAEGIDCLPTATIFTELERTGYENLTQKLTFCKAYFSSQWKFLIHTILQCLSAKTTAWNEFSSTMASAIICLVTKQKFNLSKFIFNNMMKNLDGGVKFLMYPRFVQVFLDKQVEGITRHKDVYVTPSHTKKVFANMKRPCKGFSGRVTPLFSTMMVQATEDIEPVTDEAHPTREVLPTGEDLDLEKAKTAQAKEITSLKKRVKQLEKRRKSRTSGLRRLRKVGSSSRVESFNDASLGSQEDASKQGRKIEDLDADAEVTLVDETQEMNDDNLMFDTGVLEEQEIEFDLGKKEEEPTSPLIESWDNTKAMMEADLCMCSEGYKM
ncbi:putative ribonuclease H-like domain-containing protein [Tanacetum coccineum]